MPARGQVLGTSTLTALVVANMIGAGVFTTSGFALGDLGSPWRVLAAWLVGGLVALCGAQSYGALARLMPASGGEYFYLSRVVHPLAGFVAGWISLLAGFTGAIAYAALTFSAYALPGADTLTANAVATLVIALAGLLHALRVRQGAWAQNAVVAVKLALIAAFLVAAAVAAARGGFRGLAPPAAIPPFSLPAFALTLMWISFSYCGFNAAVYVADEVPAAAGRVPRALVLGTLATLVVYLALNAVFVLAPRFEAVAFQEDVAAIAARAIGGPTVATLVRIIVALALVTSVSAMIMVGPRVYAKMADDGLMPARLKFASDAPTAAVLMQAALAAIVVWIAGLRELLSYLGFTLGLSTAATVASLFVLVRRTPERAAELPGYPWAPAVFIAATLVFAALAATRSPVEMAAALVTVASGALLYFVLARR